ncbi:MAG TPA: glycosyltransferase [Trebonia sp.]|nr:glycosyltransferase [Trebonia sp.]
MASTPPTPRPPDIEIIVPARNEARRLPAGLRALCAKAATLPVPAAIVVVDSASTDSTAEVARNWPAGSVPVRLLRCDRPGKGLAVRTGLLATQAPVVGFCDADMATDLSALDAAIGLLAAGHQVVIGSRGLRESVVESRSSTVRRAGAFVFRAVAAAIVPGSTDTQCGFKFFAGPLARTAAGSLRTSGFSFDVELLASCLRLGATVTEIPVQWQDVSGSTFSVSRHSAAVFRDLASIWLRSQAQPDRVKQDEAQATEGSPAGYAGWATPAAPLPQLASDGVAS